VEGAVASGSSQGQSAAGEATQSEDADALVRLAALVHDTFSRVAHRHDLTPIQARLLCVLVNGPRGMAELAHAFGVEKAALTGLADRAGQRGLAKRIPVPGDRRAVRMTLTDIGGRKAAAFHAEMAAELTALLSPLAPADREQFRTALAKIIGQAEGS
jgi:DNA-binding MarR family transcriptional regulator